MLELASRDHARKLIPLLRLALKEARCELRDLEVHKTRYTNFATFSI